MTNLIELRTVDQFLADYRPSYNPIMPLFLDNAQAYEVTAGKVNFTRAETVGDLRSMFIGPKDTEWHQITAKNGSKGFKKYFLGSQFVQSQLQDTRSYESIVASVLDEHNKQADELLLTGEGTSAGTVINNGLYWSSDSNYVLKASAEVAKATDGTHLADLYAKMVSDIQVAQQVSGRILVLTYGDVAVAKFNGLFASNSMPFAKAIGDAMEGVQFAKLPSAITPSGANGYIIVNLDAVKLHYCLLPSIRGQGVNEEKLYAWTNFLMGSSMLDVLSYNGVIRQPLTFAV